MKPRLKSIKDALNLKHLCFLKYVIEFISNNILLPAKQIVNCITHPLFWARPQTGFSIGNCLFSIVNSLGLGTDLVQSCCSQINKKDNSIFNQLKNKRFSTNGCVNICETTLNS